MLKSQRLFYERLSRMSWPWTHPDVMKMKPSQSTSQTPTNFHLLNVFQRNSEGPSTQQFLNVAGDDPVQLAGAATSAETEFSQNVGDLLEASAASSSDSSPIVLTEDVDRGRKMRVIIWDFLIVLSLVLSAYITVFKIEAMSSKKWIVRKRQTVVKPAPTPDNKGSKGKLVSFNISTISWASDTSVLPVDKSTNASKVTEIPMDTDRFEECLSWEV